MLEFQKHLIHVRMLSPATAERYIRRVLRALKAGLDLRKSPEEILDIVISLGKSDSDYNQWVASVKRYVEFCEWRDKEKYGCTELLHIRNKRSKLPKPLSMEEIDLICNEIPLEGVGIRDRAVIELLYCGLRNSEVCNIRWSDLDIGVVSILGKGAKERLVPINDVAWNKLLLYGVSHAALPEEQDLFLKLGADAFFRIVQLRVGDEDVFKTSMNHKLYPREVRNIVYRYAKLAGVEGAHPHRFRHSFATHTLDQGLGNLIALKDVLGHEKFDMVNQYVLTTRTGRELVKGFHPRQRLHIE